MNLSLMYKVAFLKKKKSSNGSQEENGVHIHWAVKCEDLFNSINCKIYIIH